MTNHDWTCDVYEGSLQIIVQDMESLEKEYGPEDDEKDEYFQRFLKLVAAA